MEFTFGIITTHGNEGRVKQTVMDIWLGLCDDIGTLFYPKIIVVGGNPDLMQNAYIRPTFIQFDETIKPNWITHKKNLIVQAATCENIVLMHDYVTLQPGWLKGFKEFGNNWLTCTNKIQNLDGSRFRDFCVIANDAWTDYGDGAKPNFRGDGRLLNYDIEVYTPFERWAYYSGAYFVAKRQVLLEVPLDENRVWGQGEDVKWCRDIYFKYGPEALAFNPHSIVKLLKQKERAPWENIPPI